MPKFHSKSLVPGQGVQYSGQQLNRINESEITVVGIMSDATPSIDPWKTEILKAKIAAVESLRMSPRAHNLVLRDCTFNSRHGIVESHGFLQLKDIVTADYKPIETGGLTNLYDAGFDIVSSVIDYGEKLIDDEVVVDANAIAYILTDGFNNAGQGSPEYIAEAVKQCFRNEKLESVLVCLIRVNAHDYQYELDDFKTRAEIHEDIDLGNADKASLAKLTNFISKSVSLQSQAIGSGTSANLASLTI